MAEAANILLFAASNQQSAFTITGIAEALLHLRRRFDRRQLVPHTLLSSLMPGLHQNLQLMIGPNHVFEA